MPIVKQIISSHNKTILTKDNNTESRTNNCNCCAKEACTSRPEMPNVNPNLPSHGDKT